MADGNPKDVFQSVMQFCMNDKIREALNPIRCLSEAAQIRIQAERISATARELAKDETGSVVSALSSVRERFEPMTRIYKGIYGMLAGLANKELATIHSLTMPVDGLYANPHFWRSRILANMLAASSYYKVTAELISLAMKTLDKCPPSLIASEIALLLDHALALLVDAAKFIGTAGVELGDNGMIWENLKNATKQLQG